MSESITTPKGRVLTEYGADCYAQPFGVLNVSMGIDCFAKGGWWAQVGAYSQVHRETQAEALAWIDARLDEIAAALDPSLHARLAAAEGALRSEQLKFQQETRRTSELTQMLNEAGRFISTSDGPPGMASRNEILNRISALLARPINCASEAMKVKENALCECGSPDRPHPVGSCDPMPRDRRPK